MLGDASVESGDSSPNTCSFISVGSRSTGDERRLMPDEKVSERGNGRGKTNEEQEENENEKEEERGGGRKRETRRNKWQVLAVGTACYRRISID